MEKNRIESIKDIVDYAAERYKTNISIKYLIDKNIYSKNYIDIQDDSKKFSNVIKDLNQIGSSVAIIGETSYQWLITFLGVVNSGSIAVPIDYKLRVDDICENLQRANVTILVYDKQFEDVARSVQNKCPNVKYFINMSEEDGIGLCLGKYLESKNNDFEIEIDANKCCIIVFTSGTTGKSKGVMLSHKNIADNLCIVSIDMDWDCNKTSLLSVLPIHHMYSLTVDFLLEICSGIPVYINTSMIQLLDNMKIFKPTVVTLVPMIINYLYKIACTFANQSPSVPKIDIAKNLFGGQLDKIISCGSFLDAEIEEGFSKFGIKIIQGYGMTECSSHISSNSYCIPKIKSVGKLLRGLQVKFVDQEIFVKGSSVMLGYLNDKEATEEVLNDGWLATGDLGYIDEDNYLYLTGRKKYLIITSSGENVSPEELENQIMRSTLIKEVLVYDKDDLIIAEVYPDLNYIENNHIEDVEEKINYVVKEINKKNPSYKHICKVIIRNEEFTKTTSNKIKRNYYIR